MKLRYRDDTPIATCHWQWIGNILADGGFDDAWERLGLSWGCRWLGGPVLLGLGTWPAVLRATSGAKVEILTFDDPRAARDTELILGEQGRPYVVEIDAYYVPAAHRARDHVVHAVLVAHRDSDRAAIVDATIGPRPIGFSASDYELMRASDCDGRVEGHKLYVVSRQPSADPAPAAVLDAVRRHLDATFPDSLRTLERYVAWVAAGADPVDVCRAAGERYQAARLFEYLDSRELAEATRPRLLLGHLSRNWYLVYMLATHESGAEARHRQRVVRLLERLIADEAAVAEAVLG
jgi:hypothetical protein